MEHLQSETQPTRASQGWASQGQFFKLKTEDESTTSGQDVKHEISPEMGDLIAERYLAHIMREQLKVCEGAV